MDQVVDDPRPGELLQVAAGLAQCNAVAFDLADAKPLADQVVQPYTANRQLPSCAARWEPDLVDDLLLNECESTSRGAPIGSKWRSPSKPLPATALTDSTIHSRGFRGAPRWMATTVIGSACLHDRTHPASS